MFHAGSSVCRCRQVCTYALTAHHGLPLMCYEYVVHRLLRRLVGACAGQCRHGYHGLSTGDLSWHAACGRACHKSWSLPVGAAKASWRPWALHSFTMVAVAVVLPHPGPPVSTSSGASLACSTACCCPSDSLVPSAQAAMPSLVHMACGLECMQQLCIITVCRLDCDSHLVCCTLRMYHEHVRVHAHTWACMHAHTHTHTRTRTRTRTRARARARARTSTRARARAHAHTRTRTHTHTHTHTHSHCRREAGGS